MLGFCPEEISGLRCARLHGGDVFGRDPRLPASAVDEAGRVEGWSGGERHRGVAVAGGFRRVPVPQSAPWLRFQPPPDRTQRADFPHCTLLLTSRQGQWDLSYWGRFRRGHATPGTHGRVPDCRRATGYSTASRRSLLRWRARLRCLRIRCSTQWLTYRKHRLALPMAK